MDRTTKQRRRSLISLLEEHGDIRVHALAGKLGVSGTTIRRDLHALAKDKALVRIHGGARLLEPQSLVARTFDEKLNRMRQEKAKIGRVAAGMVKSGMVVALDNGTTAWQIAAALKDKAPLTILTSALAAIEELGGIEGISIFLSGGKFRPENLDFVGMGTAETFKKFHADISFTSADAFLMGRGTFGVDEISASMSAAVAMCADRKVVTIDHSKFTGKGCYPVLPVSEIDCLVTDAGLDENLSRQLSHAPFELILAQ
ncbi:MAG: DeoR/GlpR transcriptional regulator [Phycisphaerae bacterium]|nr:DeoR/GlpR transcriptional regulator [Phycisphaerae bacterium]